jgi:hypothetical protein
MAAQLKEKVVAAQEKEKPETEGKSTQRKRMEGWWDGVIGVRNAEAELEDEMDADSMASGTYYSARSSLALTF